MKLVWVSRLGSLDPCPESPRPCRATAGAWCRSSPAWCASRGLRCPRSPGALSSRPAGQAAARRPTLLRALALSRLYPSGARELESRATLPGKERGRISPTLRCIAARPIDNRVHRITHAKKHYNCAGRPAERGPLDSGHSRGVPPGRCGACRSNGWKNTKASVQPAAAHSDVGRGGRQFVLCFACHVWFSFLACRIFSRRSAHCLFSAVALS